MKHMKRILSVLLLISLLPLLPLTAAAEGEAGGTPGPKTVYVSSSGDDATAAVGDKTRPYADFLTAYGQLTQTGGTVVLLDDVTIDLTTDEYKAVASAHRFKLPASEKEIAICGTRQEGGQYSKLIFKNTTGVCVELQGDVTFYDLTIGFTTDKSSGNLWFAANGYRITIGFRFSHAFKSAKGNIVGGAQAAGVGIPMNTAYGPTVTIYSGTWNNIFAASFASGIIEKTATINLCGDLSAAIVAPCRNKAAGTLKADAVINYYKGTVTDFYDYGKAVTLNAYNGLQETVKTTFTNTTESQLVVCGESLPAPAYALNFYGTQVTAVNGQGKYSVRFVGILHSTDYSAVGLLIRTASQTYGGCCEKVYTSILGDFDRYTAEALGGNYLFAWTIQNIPADAGAVTFTVTPFLAVGDTVWYGQEKSVTYQAGILQQ